MNSGQRTDIAVFTATSGHSGVDRIMANLVPEFARRGLLTDVLQIEGHGPHWRQLPTGARLVPLGVKHVNSSLVPLIRYLRDNRPRFMLTDKDNVNRIALWARSVARVDTRISVRVGTNVSNNLARRSRWSRWSQFASIRLFYRFADTIITPSQGAADDLARIAGLAHHRVRALASPVVSGKLVQRAREPVNHPWLSDTATPLILGVGELSARKNFSMLIRAFAMLRQQRPCRLLILGEGKQRDTLQALAQTLSIAGDVALPGFQPNPYPYMARAAVFALTSICEGSPVVLMEALGLGTNVVATDCPSGPREVVQSGRYGQLVAIDDDDALTRALAHALDRPMTEDDLREAAAPYRIDAAASAYLRAMGVTATGQDATTDSAA